MKGKKKSTFVSQHSYVYFIQKHFTGVYCSHYTTVFAAFSSLSTAQNIFCFEPFDIGIIRAPIKRWGSKGLVSLRAENCSVSKGSRWIPYQTFWLQSTDLPPCLLHKNLTTKTKQKECPNVPGISHLPLQIHSLTFFVKLLDPAFRPVCSTPNGSLPYGLELGLAHGGHRGISAHKRKCGLAVALHQSTEQPLPDLVKHTPLCVEAHRWSGLDFW